MLGPARIKPWEIGRLTLADIADLLDEDFDAVRPPARARGGLPMTHEERLTALAKYRALTPRQKLDQFQRQRKGV